MSPEQSYLVFFLILVTLIVLFVACFIRDPRRRFIVGFFMTVGAGMLVIFMMRMNYAHEREVMDNQLAEEMAAFGRPSDEVREREPTPAITPFPTRVLKPTPQSTPSPREIAERIAEKYRAK